MLKKALHKLYHAKYHGIYNHAKQLFVFDIALLLTSLVILGIGLFFIFWKPSITNYIDLAISLGENRIESGSLVRLTVDYANRSNFNLNNVSLALHLPQGFAVDRNKTLVEYFNNDSIFNLKQIKASAKGQLEIYGRYWATPNTPERILALLSYEPRDTKRVEQKTTAFFATLSGSVLASKVEIVTSTFANQDLTYKYTITNTGGETVEKIFLTKNLPFEPKVEEIIASELTLKPNESKIFESKITSLEGSGNFVLNFIPTVVINNHPIPQTSLSQNILVFAPKLSSAVTAKNNIPYAEPGQAIPVQISWKNLSDYKLTNLKLSVKFNYQIVDLSATAKQNNLKTDGEYLVADQTNRTSLSPNKNGGDNFVVNIIMLPNFNLTDVENANLEITPVLETSLDEVKYQTYTQDGQSFKIPLATELSLNIVPVYYTEDGDQLGRGPLPPRVGQTTKYWVMIQIANTNNAINNAKFSASLPPGAIFTGKQSVTIGPEVIYNQTNQTLNWNYYHLPANSVTGLYFEVAVTPTTDQIGQTLELIKDIKITATDDWVNKPFNLSQAILNNALGATDKGYTKGAKVVK